MEKIESSEDQYDYEEIKNKLCDLAHDYSYNLEDKHFKRLMDLYFYKVDMECDGFWFSGVERFAYELASMLDILNKAINSRSGFTLKSKKKKIEVTYIDNIHYMHEFINEMLYEYRHDDYKEVLNWKDKELDFKYASSKYLKHFSESEFKEYKDSILKEGDFEYLMPKLYNDSEIKEILRFEKKQLNNFGKVKNQRMSYYLHGIVKEFVNDGIFKELKTISTKDASFLYDCLCLFGLHEDTEAEDSQGKYQFIKSELLKLKDSDMQINNRILIP